MFFGANCALSGLQAFLPTIIASFGFGRHTYPSDLDWCLLMRSCSRCGRPGAHSATLLRRRYDSLLDDVHFGPPATSWRVYCGCGYPGRYRIHVRRLSPPPGALYHMCSDRDATRGRLLIAFPSNGHVRYFATFCTCAGTAAHVALVLTWCACPPFPP